MIYRGRYLVRLSTAKTFAAFVIILLSLEYVLGFRCWCENIIGCGKRTDIQCRQSELTAGASCLMIIRAGGDTIRACGGSRMPDLCFHSTLTETTTCSCSTEFCNQAPRSLVPLPLYIMLTCTSVLTMLENFLPSNVLWHTKGG
ncbi:uncharacterized protein LOC129581938 [Paramacrobiotus metropolitanus]|uniref:uncharacterized protein LOC129581938 n=1 Tax=Paramacrobiotus metropolitanus TaxID=2943436 RepID=UPI0024458AB2|nr:uncharacterized protein LOC129581938 [Paramacrobiotus metropolitanus]